MRPAYCPSCGAVVGEADRFCRTCGAELPGRGDPAPAGGPAAPPPPRPLPPAPLPPPAPPAPPAPTRTPAHPGTERRARLLTVGLLVAGLSLAGAGAWLLLTGGDEAEVKLSTDVGPGPVAAESTAPPSQTAGPTASPSPEATPSPEPADPLAGWGSCSNAEIGFALRYPPEWRTEHATPEQACRFFDPGPFTVQAGDDLPRAAIRIYRPDSRYRALVRSLDSEEFQVLERGDLLVDGREAVRVLLRVSTAEQGRTQLYAYVVNLGGDALVIDAFRSYSEDFPATREVMDLLVSTLEFG